MIEFFAFSVLRFKTNKIVKMRNAKIFTNFLKSQSYICSREFGSKPFHVTVSNSHQGYNEYSLKKPPANGYFLFFYLALCAHETCFMTRPWKRMVCMYFCQQQASQHNTVVAGKSLYFCWKKEWDIWMNLLTSGAGFKFIKQWLNIWINAVRFNPTVMYVVWLVLSLLWWCWPITCLKCRECI